MATFKFYVGFLVLTIVAISRVQSTCVFDSDFGFKLNCAFRKSSLFRVRNLGGFKAHVGLGFSLGDELGFDQSLSNLDNRRRSVAAKNGSPFNAVAGAQQNQRSNTKQGQNKNRITVRQPTTSTTAAPTTQTVQQTTPTNLDTSELQMGRSLNRPMNIPPFKPIPPATDMVAPTPTKQSYVYTTITNPNRIGHTANANLVNLSAGPVRLFNRGSNTLTSSISVGNPSDQAIKTIPAPSMGQYPKFNAMPSSISRISMAAIQNQPNDKQSGGVSVVPGQMYKNTVQVPIAPTMMSKTPSVASFLQNSLSLRKSPSYPVQNNNQKIDNMLTYNVVQSAANDVFQQNSYQQKIAAISKATNISVEAIEAAVRLRQNQIINQMINAARSTSTSTTTTTTTTTTPRPIIVNVPTNPPKRYTTPSPQVQLKVMNAPKEYYPVGYEKNFDDNFVSKVDLPETSFYCGDQKHFPGLYGDEDLGCMVFHVCALTDDGLIMKSFLCPESTLFDQTILKCNWWFYVDCKSSKRLYDSNIPISKSYQLMKALTFFSSYKKDQTGDQENAASGIEENKEGINNAVKILQTQSRMQLPKVEEFVISAAENVPRVEIVEVSKGNRSQVVRGSKVFVPVNANEVNALSIADEEKENVSVEVEDKSRTKSFGRHRKEEIIVGKPSVASTTTESSYHRRRTTNSSKEKLDRSTTKSIESSTDSNKKHRSERASGEVIDETTKRPSIEITEVTGSTVNKVIQTTMNSASISETIAKMDEAIIGKKN